MGPPLGSALPFLLWKQERKSDKSDGWAVVHLRKRLGGQIKLFTDHFNVSLSRYTDQWSAQAIEKSYIAQQGISLTVMEGYWTGMKIEENVPSIHLSLYALCSSKECKEKDRTGMERVVKHSFFREAPQTELLQPSDPHYPSKSK